MKPFLIIPTSICINLATWTQKVVVMPERTNKLMVGADNPLSIAAENISINCLVVEASKGTITGNAGNYIYYGSEVGIYTTVFRETRQLIPIILTITD